MVKKAREMIKLLNRHWSIIAFQWVPSHIRIQGNEIADLLAKKGTTLQSQLVSPNFKTVKMIIKRNKKIRRCHSFIQQQWQNTQSTWEAIKTNPENKELQIFSSWTGHDCLVPHLHHVKIFSHSCIICNQQSTTINKEGVYLLVYTKLDRTIQENKEV